MKKNQPPRRIVTNYINPETGIIYNIGEFTHEEEDEKNLMISTLYKIKTFFLRMFTKCYWEVDHEKPEGFSGHFILRGCTGRSSMKYYDMDSEHYCQNCGRVVEQI
jgi:hypothetical protein